MNAPHVLVLGGTSEARALAAALDVAPGVTFMSSLAGRVSAPRLPVGPVRIGGFGGVDGLAQEIRARRCTHVVDATHPFASRMHENAARAADQAGVTLVRYARPGWAHHPDAASWNWVRDYDEARRRVEQLAYVRPFLTTGRQTLGHFRPWSAQPSGGPHVLVRVVEPLEHEPPERWTVLLDRGPFTRDDEAELMRRHGVDVLVTKDSGGRYTAAKLDAARDLGVPVVIVRRPGAPAGIETVDTLDGVLLRLGIEVPQAAPAPNR